MGKPQAPKTKTSASRGVGKKGTGGNKVKGASAAGGGRSVGKRAAAPPPKAAKNRGAKKEGEEQDERTVGQRTSGIKNKVARSQLYNELRSKAQAEKKKARKKRAEDEAKALALGEEPPPRKLPNTIENTREKDETMVSPGDEEVEADNAEDEFADYFNQSVTPKILLTTSRHPSANMFRFLENLFDVIPNAYYYARRAYDVKEIVAYAKNREFTDVLVFNENKKFSKGARVNGLLFIHLPDGPTAHFKLSSLVLTKGIRGHGRATRHRPELILNNFGTRLGHRMGRLFASLWPPNPEFRGRRVVTLHNQRDYIFFRHHRYVFEQRTDGKEAPIPQGHLYDGTPRAAKVKGKKKAGDAAGEAKGGADAAVKCRLQELGPRFTLKLQSVQKGTFDSKRGEYEWVRPPPGVAAGASRRRFFL